ncbi:hypothetical protein F5Y04DRAFT_223053 [Hypomontagnella monticulosa]|nr:hypothetical protein F5Y04DRAFT_223053 [Hypomontagnella monticulosa]
MRISALTLLASALASLAYSQRTPDPSAVFIADLFTSVSDCSATSGIKAFLYSRGACQNIATPGAGSARVRYNERPAELSLVGWTGKDCTGERVEVGAEVGVCVPLNGTDVVSWSY